MNEEHHSFGLSRQEFRYEFVSIGKRKQITKIVLFTETHWDKIYNLALFDCLDDGSVSAYVDSGNGDERLVFATIIKIIDHFLTIKSDCLIIFRGNDDRRHRLFRIVITTALSDLSKTFQVYGIVRDRSLRFKPNKLYDSYMIRKI